MNRLRMYVLVAATITAWLVGGALLDGPSETDAQQASMLTHRDAMRAARHARLATDPRIAAATGERQ
jgi:hypothetical protein